jgi:pimeloyl-ACP methyl ester carboxylesterase
MPAMADESYPIPVVERHVRANGLDIFCLEAGAGEPLLLLHGGTQTNGWVWAGHKWSWASHVPVFAQHFRVIAPDTRAHGRTANPARAMAYPLLADDFAALIHALELDRPLVCGFSDGGIAASLMAIREPGIARALVNVAGYDVFNPEAPSFRAMRRSLGGDEAAECIDLDLLERKASAELKRLLRAAHDRYQGEGYWKAYYEQMFPMWTRPIDGYTPDHFRRIAVPTLILVGDRDQFCTVEEGAAAYRLLARGELCVLPRTDHVITPLVRDVALDFLLRHAGRGG